MHYENCFLNAAMMVIEWHLPLPLMPLTITSQASLLAELEPEHIAGVWD